MEQQNAGAPAQRPTFLTVLCILSWIWQGIVAIFLVLAMLAIGVVSAVAESDAVQEGLAEMSASDPSMADAVASTASASVGMLWAAVIVGFLCVILSFIGVLQMWKLKKTGFYLYTAAFLISTIMGFVAGDASIGGVIFSGAFVAMYGLNLKHMS
jgi:hypothetical protein